MIEDEYGQKGKTYYYNHIWIDWLTHFLFYEEDLMIVHFKTLKVNVCFANSY